MNDITQTVNSNLQDIAKAIDDILEDVAGERLGFALVIFTDNQMQYVGNTNRDEIQGAFKVLADKWDIDHDIH